MTDVLSQDVLSQDVLSVNRQFTSIREQRWTDPDTEGGFQVSRQGEQGEQESKGNKGNKGQIMYIS